MKLTYETKSLFDMPHGYMLAYCTSSDYVLSSELEKEFDTRYNMKDKLSLIYPEDVPIEFVGSALLIENVFNLIIKRTCSDKANYTVLQHVLEDLKFIMLSNHMKHLAMPQICCGNNGLEWDVVSVIIEEVFADTDIEITICSI